MKLVPKPPAAGHGGVHGDLRAPTGSSSCRGRRSRSRYPTRVVVDRCLSLSGSSASRTTASSSSTSASCRSRRSTSSAGRRPRSPRRSGRWSCAARPRSGSPPPTGSRSPRPRGEDLDAADAVLRDVAADGGQSRLGARRDARRPVAPSTPGRSTATRSSAAGRWPRTPPGCSRPERARSRTATPAGSRRAATAARSERCSPPGSATCSTHVWVDETRPLLQGARLTAWELETAGIPHAVIADSAAASRMAAGEVDVVFTGADRIAANGDTANKIGTYGLAVLAAPPRDPVLHRRAELDRRPRDRDGDGDPDRGARPGRGDRALPGAEPGVRRHAGGADHGDRHRARRPPGAVRSSRSPGAVVAA